MSAPLKVVGVMVAVIATTLGCGAKGHPPATPLEADEVRGSLGGVEFGDGKATVRKRFGDLGRRPEPYPIEPLGVDEAEGSGGPWSVVTGPHHVGPGGLDGEQVTLRYRGTSFFVRDDRVFGFMVTDSDGRTSRDVGIGDDLSKVPKAYPELECEDESRGETTAIQKASCSGQVQGGRSLYFGGDPIESITVMQRSFKSYDY